MVQIEESNLGLNYKQTEKNNSLTEFNTKSKQNKKIDNTRDSPIILSAEKRKLEKVIHRQTVRDDARLCTGSTVDCLHVL